MSSIVRTIINALPPSIGVPLDHWQQPLRHKPLRRHIRRQRELLAKLGSPDRILYGPFKGLKYKHWAPTGVGIGNVLGAYEHELDESVEAAIALQPDLLVNIGSAEGYFTLGMAMRLPRTRVIGYDLLASARFLLAKNAALNAMSGRVEQRGRCDPPDLARDLESTKRSLVVCDCEGFEDALLDPASVPGIAGAIIIVEVHDAPGYAPGVATRLLARFGSTHTINTIHERPLAAADKPGDCKLSDEEFLEAVAGARGLPGLWYFMVPRGMVA